MPRPPRRTTLWCAGVLACLAVGCSSRPTYPKEHIADSLQALMVEDHLNASVRFLNHTLAVQLMFPGVLVHDGGQVSLGPAFDEAARRVLTVIHRVLLSSDAEVYFYVLLVSDPGTPGAYVTIVRYMDDIRRANANMLDTPEIFARTILELNITGSVPLTIDQYVPRDITLEDFLSWQLARRIQHTLMDELQPSGIARVGRCAGEFRDGEFAFTLDVAPAASATLDDATMDKIFQASTNVIARVLSSYQFNAFDSVRLVHPLSGRNLILPKARLDVFR